MRWLSVEFWGFCSGLQVTVRILYLHYETKEYVVVHVANKGKGWDSEDAETFNRFWLRAVTCK